MGKVSTSIAKSILLTHCEEFVFEGNLDNVPIEKILEAMIKFSDLVLCHKATDFKRKIKKELIETLDKL